MGRILLKNVQPVGFSTKLQRGMDMAIDSGGSIEKIGFGLANTGNDLEIDLGKWMISPGWIDMHAHVFHPATNISIDPDTIGPISGVTAIVDAGSAGSANFVGFRDYVIRKRNFPIASFINISAQGLVYVNYVSELSSLEQINLDDLAVCVNENRQYIKGLKIRASGVILRGLGIEMVKLAKRTAVELDLPLMIHVGEPLPMLEDILDLMEQGDIVTHCFHGKKWGILKKGEPIPEFVRAYRRGVLFDVGHGSASFNFEVAEKAVSAGFIPFSIGTDLHIQNLSGPVWDLPTTMSKMLSIGMSLEEVIRGVTANPASVIGLDTFQDQLEGAAARFTIFSIDSKRLRVKDSNGNERVLERIFNPLKVVIGTRVTESSLRHPITV